VVCIRAINKVDGFPVYETVRTVAATVSQNQQPKLGNPAGSPAGARELQPPVEVRAMTRSSTSIVVNWLDQEFFGSSSSQHQNRDGHQQRFYNVSIR